MLALTVLAPYRAVPAELNLPRGVYPYYPVNQDIRDVVTQFGLNTGVPVKLSNGVHGRVRSPLETASAAGFLASLSATYQVDWVFDGSTLVFSDRSERESKSLGTKHLRVADLEAQLQDAGVLDRRYIISATHDGMGITIDGPPRYVELVSALVQQQGSAPEPADNAPSQGLTVMRGTSISHQSFQNLDTK